MVQVSRAVSFALKLPHFVRLYLPLGMKKHFLFLTACAFCIGCIPTIKLIYGITKEREEPRNFQKEWLLKNDLDTQNLVNLTHQGRVAFANQASLRSTINTTDGMTIPQFRIYRADGTIMAAWGQCFGSLKRTGILDTFPPKQHWLLNKELKLKNDYDALGLDDKAIPKDQPVVIAFWAAYLGRFSKTMLQDLQQYCHNNFAEYHLVKVNIGRVNSEDESE